jgi:hypothetical protein
VAALVVEEPGHPELPGDQAGSHCLPASRA